MKTRLGLFEWTELGKLSYPLRYTATFEYYATGEGVTHGLLIGHAHTETDLRKAVVDAWGDYFAKDVCVRAGWTPPPPYGRLLPPMAKQAIDRVRNVLPGRLVFSATLHVNHA